jgi:hypothetical protein
LVVVLLHNTLVDNGTTIPDNVSSQQSMHGFDRRMS